MSCPEARERLPAELGLSTTPGRVFRRSSELKKLCRRGMRTYRFYLFNDMILYCKWVPARLHSPPFVAALELFVCASL